VARDVEFNVTASDKTGNALNKAAREFEKTQQKIKDDAEKAFGGLGRSLIATANLAGPKVGAAITRGIAQAAQLAGPLLGSVAAYAAPLIAGTLSAAIIGGVGIGGVVGGVALAARDPRVSSAGKQLGNQLLATLTDAAAPFIGPVLDSIDRIRGKFSEVEGNVRRIFANSAKFVAPLTEGVTNFGQSVIRAFDNVIGKAAPVIAAIRVGFTQLGGDIEGFLDTITGDGQAAATSMAQLFDLISGTLAVLGPLIRGLNEVNGALARIGIQPGILQLIAQITKGGQETGTFSRHVAGAADAFNHVNPAAANYAQTLEALAETQRRLIGENASLYASQTTAAQAYRDATKAVKENGEGISLNSKAGLANRQVLSNLATSLNANYDAYVKVNGAGQGANEVLRQNRDNFVKVATQATGSAAAAQRLADKLIGIPDRKPKIELLDNATGKVNNVINRLAAVKSKTVTLNIAVRQSGDAAALRKQSQTNAFSAGTYASQAAADGGRYRTGGPTPVSVASTVNVLLDGAPFRQQTVEVVNEQQRRQAWREKVGTH
jgi:hypothetical protein